MFTRLATITYLVRQATVRRIPSSPNATIRPSVRWRAPRRDRPMLQCHWQIERSGKLACVWSIAEPMPHVASPPLQPLAPIPEEPPLHGRGAVSALMS